MTMMKAVAEKALSALGYPEAGLALSFVGTDMISLLHDQYFDDPTETNVISLEYGMPPEFPSAMLGEVFVCVPVAESEANAAAIPMTLEFRLAQLVVHGLLHVIGHEHVGVDDGARRAMEELERQLELEVIKPLVAA